MDELDHLTFLTLQALEESMWRSETRFDRAYMEAVLHPDFAEIGRSGRLYSRQDVLDLPPVDIRVAIPLTGLRATVLSTGVVLLHYTTVPLDSPHGAAHRSSVWVADGERWRLRFHQGTPASDVDPG